MKYPALYDGALATRYDWPMPIPTCPIAIESSKINLGPIMVMQ